MRNHSTKKIVRLALFLALGVVLNIIESMLPILIPIPGVKLGIANTIGLIVLYYYGPKEYTLIGFLRVLLVALLRTGIGSISFILSLSGWLLSTLFVLFVYNFKKVSIYGLSMSSAVMHGIGQIIMVVFIYSLPEMINYLPILIVSGIISGNVLALLCSELLKKLDKVMR
jgi:heptaprenyl diphosphate synthase